MQFTNLSHAYLAVQVAIPVAKYCQKQYGKSGFKIDAELHTDLNWRPSIQLKTSQFASLAVEVSELLFPAILKSVSHDLTNALADHPTAVYVACPLAVFQADHRHVLANQLRTYGFGLFTVDDVGNVIEQIVGIPLIHHISSLEFQRETKTLPSRVRVKVNKAYAVYKTNSYQGLQDIAHVEAIVLGLAHGAEKAGWISKIRSNLADVLDDLYASSEKKLRDQRAAIGAARGFVKYHRNMSSHAPRSRADLATLIRNCRKGFVQAIEVANLLCSATKACGFPVRMYIP